MLAIDLKAKNVHYILFLLFFLSFNCQDSKDNDIMSFSLEDPTIIAENGHEIFQYWEIKDEQYLWNHKLGQTEALEAYKDSISKTIGDSVLSKLVEEQWIQLKPNNENVEVDSLDNYDLIHQGYLGEIRQINLMETELLNYQMLRFPMFSQPTEFHCFVLKNDSIGNIRVYFGASDQPWPPKPKPIITHIENALDSGWHLKLHLHNHYEPETNNYLGVMAPSLADVHYFKVLKKRFDLPEALITNGFTTVVLKDSDFTKLNSH